MNRFIAFVLFSVFSAYALSDDLLQDPSLQEAGWKAFMEGDARRHIRNDWFSALREVVEKTHDSQAKAVLDILNSSTVLAMPNDKGVIFLEDAKPGSWIHFIPVTAADGQYDLWKPFAATSGTHAVAHFLHDRRALIVKGSVDMSPVFKGILLVHEGDHARRFLEHPYESQSDEEYCIEEKEVHQFQNRITLALGGKKYEDLLLGEVKRLHDGLKKLKRKVGGAYVSPRHYHEEMDGIFGPALSDGEKDARESWFWIDANFRLIDQYYRGDKERNKSLFLCSLYKQNGIR